jgi:hypothetical protein
MSLLRECENDAPNLGTDSVEQGEDLISARVFGAGWITLVVPHRNYYFQKNAIPVHIRRRSVTNNRKDLCAIFYLPEIEDVCKGSPIVGMFTLEAKLSLADCSVSQPRQSVFVRVVEFSQHTQERRQHWMRSVVRLEHLESCPHRFTDFSQRPLADSFVKILPSIGNGESKSPMIGRGSGFGFTDRNSSSQIIEGRTEIAESIGHDQSPSLELSWLHDTENETVTGAVVVHFLDEVVRISLHPGVGFIADGLSVFLAPSELGKYAGEV